MNLTSPHLFQWNDVETERVTGQIRRKVISGEHLMAAHIWLDRGAIVPRHSHEAEQLSWIFSGALKFIVAGETIVVGPGEMLHLPSGIPHEAVALQDTYEMDVFSPIRRDWLEKSDGYFHQAPAEAAGFTNPATEGNPASLYRWRDTPIERQTSHILRAYLSGERATVAQIALTRGAIVPTHSHDSEQLTWVRDGVLELDLDGTAFTVRPGSVLRIPAWLPHGATAPEDARVLDLFSPRRDDWIRKTDHYFRRGNPAR